MRPYVRGEWGKGIWVCWKDHWIPSHYPGYALARGPIRHENLRSLMLCLVSHYPALTAFLLRRGFLDAEHDGGVMFWRWDFWRATHRRWLLEHDHDMA